MSRADGILHLTLNFQPYDEIAAGRKPVEYRSREVWEKKIREGRYRFVRFQRGFHKVKETGVVPTMLAMIERIDIGTADPRWTYGIVPEGEEFVRIWIGGLISESKARQP